MLPEQKAKQVDLGIYVADQFGVQIQGQTVDVSVEEAPAGVSCTDGVLYIEDTVPSDTEAILKAVAGDVEVQFCITLVRGALKIVGEERITRPVSEQQYTYRLRLRSGNTERTVDNGQTVWSLNNDAEGKLLLDADGRLTVYDDTPLGTYTISIYLRDDPEMCAEQKIEIVRNATGDGRISGGGTGGGGSGIAAQTPQPTTPAQLKQVPTFRDVPSDHWAYKAISDFAERGYISGRGDNEFACDEPVTRAEFLKILMLVMEQEIRSYDIPFRDVPEDMWYYGYVGTAYQVGLASGYDADTFGPDAPISRQDMAVLIHRALAMHHIGLQKIANSVFSDQGSVAPYAADAVNALAEAGVIAGMEDGNFAPLASATRAETVQLLYRVRLLREQTSTDA